jgi:hypothetical protein
MPHDLENILIYHITDVANLPDILAEGGLQSDAVMVKRNPEIWRMRILFLIPS